MSAKNRRRARVESNQCRVLSLFHSGRWTWWTMPGILTVAYIHCHDVEKDFDVWSVHSFASSLRRWYVDPCCGTSSWPCLAEALVVRCHGVQTVEVKRLGVVCPTLVDQDERTSILQLDENSLNSPSNELADRRLQSTTQKLVTRRH
jgi:hypothetical protein